MSGYRYASCVSWLILFTATGMAGRANAEEEIDWTGDWIFRAAPEGAAPVLNRQRMWRVPDKKVLVLDGEVCLRKGPLEMLACPRGTKEHESIVVVEALPGVVHGELIKLGAKPGSPAQFEPYKPASGTTIKIMIVWQDESGKRHAVPAQDWIKNAKTGEAMKREWVFGGSRFVVDDETRRRAYLADGGDFICVANFTTASIDLSVESSQDNDSLLYEAYADRIPPEKTKVRLVLIPQSGAGE